jgi:hypothetical protein
MKEPNENNGTLVIATQELLTIQDLDRVLRADRCCLAYAWPGKEAPSSAMLRLRQDFAGMLQLSAILYPQIEDREILAEGLLRYVGEIAKEGYLMKYAVYTTEEKKQGCVIDLWPARLPYNNQIRVPSRLSDLTAAGAAIRRVA